MNGNSLVEVKDKKQKINPTEKVLLGLKEEPKSLRTRYQFQNDTQIKKNQKIIEYDNDELVNKIYPGQKQLSIH